MQRAARHPPGQEGIIPLRRRGAPVSHYGLGELGGWVGEEAQGWQSVEALNHFAHGQRSCLSIFANLPVSTGSECNPKRSL